MPIFTDRDQVQQEIAADGWDIVWGDVITELDALTFIVSLPTGSTAAWVASRLEEQVQKFAQNATDISPEIVDQATLILEGIVEGKWLGKWDIDGLEIKGGVATYHRWWKFGLFGVRLGFKKRLLDNYQPYVGLRVARPLPLKGGGGGASMMPKRVEHTHLATSEDKS